jgi:DNA-binding transcriptional MocR family regulator
MGQGMLPQDVVVLAKLVSHGGRRPPLAQLAADLSLSSSQIHLSLKRLERARLIDVQDGRPLLRAVEEFLVHAVKYLVPAQRGEITRGMPTAYAALPLKEQITAGSDPPPVWPSADGQVRGSAFEPLHKTVPAAAAKDAVLYEILALVDALRDGRARERQIAERELAARLRKQLRD